MVLTSNCQRDSVSIDNDDKESLMQCLVNRLLRKVYRKKYLYQKSFNHLIDVFSCNDYIKVLLVVENQP